MPSLWTERYRQHFQKHFHKPFDIQVYHDGDGFALKLATHDWALPGFRVYASLGLADKLVQNDEEDFGEVILYADVPDKEAPLLFVNALFFLLHHDIPLSSRFAIGGIADMNRAFADRYDKAAIYFTRAAEEPDATDVDRDKLEVDLKKTLNKLRHGDEFGWVYQAYFISREEEEYLESYGPDAFEAKFAELDGDSYSLRRASCV